jgi:cytochrome c oxidase subunit IV
MATQITGQFIPESNPDSVKQRSRIWNVFWILFAITAFEFLVAFTKGPLNLSHVLVITIFVSLTLVKAFYIVAEFMHLRHEVKVLIWSIVIPTIFIVWLLVALLMEGGAH